MKKLFKLLFLLMLVAVVAGIVAAIVSKKKFEAMSDDEIRAFLSEKLDGKVAEDQLESIQDAVIAGVRAKRGSLDADAVSEVVEDVAEMAEESTADSKKASKAKADKAGAKASEALEAVIAISGESD